MTLSEAEQEMLDLVIANPAAAWTTSKTSPTRTMLAAWEAAGYFREVDAPAPFLVAYSITEAGRRALSAQEMGKEPQP